ncbi:hypothetical protein VOLCADRAFT_117671 [Volvox carteri f. nagariensis]|uniref:Uncharacterized protein n=1 Tax=Volvox carteri f. nagariensis TaxID=3068 RepID=D8TWK4_VOLCA|nr:uncharacterized protein VOLCADRAFT_117671 [Volvox carteri f. nagariensis]EFJ48063.1 hypothetical protein VOLCADRAFT_117671 [Volvox carteri f. nagariensis]|eukprot:XP_002950748.1 hypothetical protein VOLCADRAFT_117671 [Volvox carteri f. nagariensis]
MDGIDAAGNAPSSPSAAVATAKAHQQHNLTISSTTSSTFGGSGSALGHSQVGQQLKLQQSEPMQLSGFTAASAQSRVFSSPRQPSSTAAGPFSPRPSLSPLQEGSGVLESSGDISQDVGLTAPFTFIPLMHGPPSPVHSSAPCSPASSVVLCSGACRSSIASATYRMTSYGIDSTSSGFAFASNTALPAVADAAASVSAVGSTAAAAAVNSGGGGSSGDGSCPLVNALLGPPDAFRQCFSEFASPPSIQRRCAASAAPQPRGGAPPPGAAPAAQHHPPPRVTNCLHRPHTVHTFVSSAAAGTAAVSAAIPAVARGDSSTATAAARHTTTESLTDQPASADVSVGNTPAAVATADTALPPLSYFATASLSGCSSRRSSLRDQNSVTIKATTVVKDAAGAIDKILSRGVTALVTALRSGGPPYNSPYDSLNQAVKAIAVARQYAKETAPEGVEVTFLPFHRYDSNERADPSRFAFLVFPVPHLDEQLKTVDETVLNVARGSDVHKMASAIIAVMLDRGQAVMKAAGTEAIFVAMSAVVNARHRLILKHGFDLMLAAAWITEDTVTVMGRESKFLRFNILKTEPAGPKSRVAPSLPPMVDNY